MRCGLYGKLPSKRDFIAVSAPRAFLRLWEPWIEQGLAFGRARGSEEEWAEAFNSAPIWRFWLGPALCGEAFIGALMPSVDAIGRMYPLTLIGVASDKEEKVDPPDVDPRELWFASVEQLLLDALDPEAPFPTLLARLKTLCASPALDENAAALAGAFAQMRAELQDCAPGEASFWWTIGGPAFPPLVLAQIGMPPESAFADMLSRRPPDEAAQDAPLQTVTQPG
ncbi:type VI secretion-associated protein, BMA_A0400 family [Methylocella silvestris BL2]|uniref:Type VI secretion-associated protein, BMA_A0400 family n=1 Tax=Methylocella silvestris (strain DSM 15510 / CIP 108128 / LMG 27833 / NCIMB 13906 / BL2) TaxID=395965 RepID=B8ETF5_METSB|nr:type VI secretion system-associated protein TagF [Methylocella silvestris]ACK51797.1 type VI secretion-associated protein, BMA_A0400 family [Methylocella silvestris BL2]